MLELTGLKNDGVGPVSLSVAESECIGISGPSGCGKTRLLRMIADLDPHQGEMALKSEKACEMPATRWRRQVMYVPSESAWWGETVGEHFEKPVDDWLSQLGFDAGVRGWSVRRLSSGERQRLAIARALQYRPVVMLLDEPTANLDADNTARVEAMLENYRQQRQAAIIWVSHDLQQLGRVCSHLFSMKGGSLDEVQYAGTD